jgi:hypothetical protein
LYYRIDKIVKSDDSIDSNSFGEGIIQSSEIPKTFPNKNASNLSISNVKDGCINFIQFITECMQIIHKDTSIQLEDANIFINKGNVFHMAVELNHSDYLRFLYINGIPINKVNDEIMTPFHVAVKKKHRHMKLRLIKMLKEQHLSPMKSFNAKDSPLRLCLKQQDLDSAYELINNDLYVSDYLEALR